MILAAFIGVPVTEWTVYLFAITLGLVWPMLIAGGALATLFWIAMAYLHPDLRKAIMFSGFGLC